MTTIFKLTVLEVVLIIELLEDHLDYFSKLDEEECTKIRNLIERLQAEVKVHNEVVPKD
jgi:hypothetical protein